MAGEDAHMLGRRGSRVLGRLRARLFRPCPGARHGDTAGRHRPTTGRAEGPRHSSRMSLRHLVVRALNSACCAVDSVAYRPFVVRLTGVRGDGGGASWRVSPCGSTIGGKPGSGAETMRPQLRRACARRAGVGLPGLLSVGTTTASPWLRVLSSSGACTRRTERDDER